MPKEINVDYSRPPGRLLVFSVSSADSSLRAELELKGNAGEALTFLHQMGKPEDKAVFDTIAHMLAKVFGVFDDHVNYLASRVVRRPNEKSHLNWRPANFATTSFRRLRQFAYCHRNIAVTEWEDYCKLTKETLRYDSWTLSAVLADPDRIWVSHAHKDYGFELATWINPAILKHFKELEQEDFLHHIYRKLFEIVVSWTELHAALLGGGDQDDPPNPQLVLEEGYTAVLNQILDLAQAMIPALPRYSFA